MDEGGGWSGEPEAAEAVAVPTRWTLPQSASNESRRPKAFFWFFGLG